MRARLIRHGQTAGNAGRRYIGRTDEPLSPDGIALARQAAADPSVPLVYVSPMQRARQTAAILFPRAVQIVIPDLREMDFGDFEGRSADEMEHDTAYRAWVDGMCLGRCPGGESRAEFEARTVAAFVDAMRGAADARSLDTAVFVVHGGTIMSVLSALAEPKRDYYDWHTSNLCGYEADCLMVGGALTLTAPRPWSPGPQA